MKIKVFFLNFIMIIFLFQYTNSAMRISQTYEVVSLDAVTATRILMHSVKDSQDYTSGGITFNYPAGTFTDVPVVSVSLELKNTLYSTLFTYCPIITSNSATATTIRVNKALVALIGEAGTNDVTVNIVAEGPAE